MFFVLYGVNIIQYNMNDEEMDIIEDLDISWIEQTDNEYKMYYAEEISFIIVHYIYLNSHNEIEKIKEDKILLKIPGTILRDELLSIIKHNLLFNEMKYSLMSILKFNIDLEPMHLNTFLKNHTECGTLQSIKNIDTIKFHKSISMFHDINNLFILFYPKTNSNINNKTKKNTNANANKKTKRIRM
jgi:hypothetical protein